MRLNKLEKRYRALGVAPERAPGLARCVIERRGGFGLFRACGVPVKVKRGAAEGDVGRRKDAVWSMKKNLGIAAYAESRLDHQVEA